MKLIYFFTVLSFLILSACKGQEDHSTRVTPSQTAEQKAAQKEKAKDFDPYFTESIAISDPPRSITRNLLQDRDGDIWFASWEGIFRYDGENFINHTNKDGLRRHRAFSLLEDSDGNIWIGTIGAGLYKYNKKDKAVGRSPWKNFTVKEGLVSDKVGCLYEDRKGNIWIGTLQGVSCYNGETFKNFTMADGLINDDINSIIEDEEGNIWLAARGEAFKFDGSQFTKITTEKGMTFTNARSNLYDSKGHIWMGGNDGLWRYDGRSYQNLSTAFIGNIYEDSKGSIWFSQSDADNTYSMSLYTIGAHDLFDKEPKSKLVVRGEGQVFGILEDSDGNIWFGLERGIGKYD